MKKKVNRFSKIEKLDLRSGGKWKVHTAYGTYYVIDLDAKMGMRVPGPDRRAMEADNDWFGIEYISCNIGEPMYMDTKALVATDWYDWRITTKVTKIEPYVNEVESVA